MKQRTRIRRLKARLYPLWIYAYWCKPTEVTLSAALREFYAQARAKREDML
jgi:hypothetical protein